MKFMKLMRFMNVLTSLFGGVLVEVKSRRLRKGGRKWLPVLIMVALVGWGGIEGLHAMGKKKQDKSERVPLLKQPEPVKAQLPLQPGASSIKTTQGWAIKAREKGKAAGQWTSKTIKEGVAVPGKAVKSGAGLLRDKYFQTFTKDHYKDDMIAQSGDVAAMGKRARDLASQLKRTKPDTQRSQELNTRIDALEKKMVEKNPVLFVTYKYLTAEKRHKEPILTALIESKLTALAGEMQAQSKDLKALLEEKIRLNQSIWLSAKRGDEKGAAELRVQRDVLRAREKILQETGKEIRKSIQNLPENAQKNIDLTQRIKEEERQQAELGKVYEKKKEELHKQSVEYSKLEKEKAALESLMATGVANSKAEALASARLPVGPQSQVPDFIRRLQAARLHVPTSLTEKQNSLIKLRQEQEATPAFIALREKFELEKKESDQKHLELQINKRDTEAAMAVGKEKEQRINDGTMLRELLQEHVHAAEKETISVAREVTKDKKESVEDKKEAVKEEKSLIEQLKTVKIKTVSPEQQQAQQAEAQAFFQSAEGKAAIGLPPAHPSANKNRRLNKIEPKATGIELNRAE